MKSIDEFRRSLDHDQPPEGLTDSLQALWWETKGNWERAHKIVQDIYTKEAAWVHAYLHRKEGDEGNAGYWYSRAGRPRCTQSFDHEWEQIACSFLTA